jgi:hypothetical protein
MLKLFRWIYNLGEDHAAQQIYHWAKTEGTMELIHKIEREYGVH